MKIAIACDHGALALKEAVKAHLTARGMECVDFGTFTADSCDYPDFARTPFSNGERHKRRIEKLMAVEQS